MNRSTVANRWNLELIDDFYQRWQNDPDSVDATWQAFFEGYQLAQQGADPLGSTPEAYGRYIKSEIERWTKVVRQTGASLE